MKKYKTTKNNNNNKNFLSVTESNLFNFKNFDLPPKSKTENIRSKEVDFDIDITDEINNENK